MCWHSFVRSFVRVCCVLVTRVGSENDYSYVYTFITHDIEDSEDIEDAGNGEYYYCDECLAFFEGTQQYTTQEQVEFCVGVASEIIKNNPTWIISGLPRSKLVCICIDILNGSSTPI